VRTTLQQTLSILDGFVRRGATRKALPSAEDHDGASLLARTRTQWNEVGTRQFMRIPRNENVQQSDQDGLNRVMRALFTSAHASITLAHRSRPQ
jgi:hypothetical protein